MIDGIPNRPRYFYQTDIIGVAVSADCGMNHRVVCLVLYNIYIM